MQSGYFVGAILAMGAGAMFNLGVLIQKRAVNDNAGQESALMARLIRDRRWLLGLGIQFGIGTPLYAAAQLYIGPTLIPGLMATGLIVLALGSPAIAGEKLRRRDLVGVGMVVAAVALFGLSRLSVDLGGIDALRGPLVTRFLAMTGIVTAAALLLLASSRLRPAWRGSLTILAAGLVYALGNMWLGIFMAMVSRFARGEHGSQVLGPGGVALAVLILANLLSIVWTQQAFRHGKVATLVPLQQVPIQIVPAACYFAVFLQTPPSAAAPFFAGAGILLILAGSAVVGSADRRSAPPGAEAKPAGSP